MKPIPRSVIGETEVVGWRFYGPNWPLPHLPPRPFAKLRKEHIDWLLKHGVTIDAIERPCPIKVTYGNKSPDGRLQRNSWGQEWFVFPGAEDAILWRPETGEIATLHGRAVALGEEVFLDPATFTSDCLLKIFADPLEWLKAGRNGIVIIDWNRASENLRFIRRIEIDESLIDIYYQHMGPDSKPLVVICASDEVAA
jgi:hypothetical protein